MFKTVAESQEEMASKKGYLDQDVLYNINQPYIKGTLRSF
jgi:hypothetical protein